VTALWFILRQLCIALIAWLCERFHITGANPGPAGDFLAMLILTLAAAAIERHCPLLWSRLKAMVNARLPPADFTITPEIPELPPSNPEKENP
jgi:hypothetical protein